MNTPVREGETIEGSRTMRNRPYPVLKCSSAHQVLYSCAKRQAQRRALVAGAVDTAFRVRLRLPLAANKHELCGGLAHAGAERIFRRAPPSRSGCSTDSPHELCCPARGDPRLLLDRVRCDSPAAGGRCCKCSRRVRTGWCSPTCVSVGRSLLDDVEGRGGGSRCTV